MKNLPTTTPEDCMSRWSRNWVVVLAVSLVLVFHIALGFPVYRYTRGSEYGKQFDDSGSLLELASPTTKSRHSRRRSSLSLFDSDSDSSLERHMHEEAKRRGSMRSRGRVGSMTGRGRRKGRRMSFEEDSSTNGGSSDDGQVEEVRSIRPGGSRRQHRM
ncbi:hypothetical protein BJY59DRAFT_152157 [Rhodotorula toruloides]